MFDRQIELIGKENQQKLQKKEVLIVGCGGLGNSIATTISCIGLKKIYLIDFDKIEMHNLHRQFQFSKSDINKYKSEVLAKNISRCDTEIVFLKEKFNKNLDLKVDLVFDATDNFESRKEIDSFAKKHSIAWIYASVEEFRGQVGVFVNSSFDMFATTNAISKGQFPPMVNLVGSISSMLGIRVLLDKQKEIFYYVDFNESLEIKKFFFN